MNKLFQWIVRQSSSGDIYHLSTTTRDHEAVYRLFARKVLRLPQVVDAGNIDIDIFGPLDDMRPDNAVLAFQDERGEVR